MNDEDNKLIAERRRKLGSLREQGSAYPNDFRRDALASQLLSAYADRDAAWLDANPVRVRVGGRMMFRRIMGKASFAKIADRSGQLQLFLQDSALGPAYEAFKGYDIGDLLGAEGQLFRTRTGELSVRVETLRLLAKSLRPLPDKWHGVADTELRYRQRYVDLIMTERSREVFRTRSRVLRYLRDFLDALDFLEVETPMMQPIPGGAAARPFVTHHNALDLDMYLRIAPELYLKRLIVGGFERVYEINRNFRNEGLSTQHNPEFTMLELYWAYTDYIELMDLIERLLHGLADGLFATRLLTYQGREYDLAQPFRRVTIEDGVAAAESGARACAPARCRLSALGLRSASDRLSAARGRGQAADRIVREDRGAHAARSDLRLRLSARGLAAYRVSTMTIPSSPTASNSSSPGANSPTASRSSTIRRIRRSASVRRCSSRTAAMTRRCTTMPITCARSNTACRRPRGSDWASIGWSCS